MLEQARQPKNLVQEFQTPDNVEIDVLRSPLISAEADEFQGF